MNFFQQLASNHIFLAAVMGWASAQILKTIINLAITKKFDAERLFGSGGMPSSHSATVCALATATVLCYGPASFEFAIAAVFAIVVMYDASGVRRETGEQAVLLNKIIDTFTDLHGLHLSEEKMKELVGHTPLQVLMGAILGVLIALLMG